MLLCYTILWYEKLCLYTFYANEMIKICDKVVY